MPAAKLDAICSASFDNPVTIPSSPERVESSLPANAGLTGTEDVQTLFSNLSNIIIEVSTLKSRIEVNKLAHYKL